MSALQGQVPDLDRYLENHLAQMGSLPPPDRAAYARIAASLVGRIRDRGIRVVGISGAPGSGKSTLARVLARGLAPTGLNALVLSLDDYYLSREARNRRSKIHPLLQQRGVPGTHDWPALITHLDALVSGKKIHIKLPRFDKSIDDVADDSTFDVIERSPDVVILEGWMIGAPPQKPEDLETPANDLEANRDSDGSWRRWVNGRLGEYHTDLSKRVNEIWFLATPDWQSVVDWRTAQESEISRRGGRKHLGNRKAVRDFLNHFERISKYMTRTCHEWADLVIRIDECHRMSLD